MSRIALLLVVVGCPAAFAGDEREQAPAPPNVPRGGWTPPPSPATPSPSSPPAIDEARLSALIDDAVDRAMQRRQGTPQGAYPSPQGVAGIPAPARYRIVAAEAPRAVGTVPSYSESREYVTVMVPPGCCRRAMAAVGEKLVECGRPRLRTMRVAPAALVREVQPARAVYASGQGG